MLRLSKIFRRKGLRIRKAIKAKLSEWRARCGKLTGQERLDIIRIVNGMEVVVGALPHPLAHLLSFRHRSVDAFVVLPDGKFVLARRAHHITAPLRLSIVGGHVKAGASYLEAIKEELIEELRFPAGHKLSGRLVVVRCERAFRWNKKGNREIRAFYVYFASPREAGLILKYAASLERQKRPKTRGQFEAQLEGEYRKSHGHGETWSLHFVDWPVLAGNTSLKVRDVFADGVREETAYYTEDTLEPSVRDAVMVKEIKKILKDNRRFLISGHPRNRDLKPRRGQSASSPLKENEEGRKRRTWPLSAC